MTDIPRIEILAENFNALPSWWNTSWIRLEAEVQGQYVRIFTVTKEAPSLFPWSGREVFNQLTDHRHETRVEDLRTAGLIPQVQAA